MKPEESSLKISRIVGRFSEYFNWFAAVAGGIIFGLVSLSAIMRYAIGRPFLWSDEICGFLLFVFCFASLPIAFATKSHMIVTFFSDRIPQPAKDYVRIAVRVFALVYVAIFAKVAFQYSFVTYRLHSLSLNAALPIFPWQVSMPIVLVLTGVLILVEVIEIIREHFNWWQRHRQGGSPT